MTLGSRTVRVGIIDSGIAQHDDFNMTNTNGVVTHSNVDWDAGWDFVNNDGITDDDISGHGTSCAGIVGAMGNNGIGVTGVAQQVTLVPLQVAIYGYFVWGDAVIAAIMHARNLWDTDQRISILNMSIEGFGTVIEMLNAVEQYQGLVVWSAGNDGDNLDDFSNIDSFNLPNIIAVGAHNWWGKRSIFNLIKSSNFGNAVDVYAPGGNQGIPEMEDILTTARGNNYWFVDGTSAAAPHVAGVAALMLSINPTLTAAQLKIEIRNSATVDYFTTPAGYQTARLLCATSAVAAATFITNTSGSNVKIIGVRTGAILPSTLIIPEYINGRTVTQIGSSAFSGQGQLTQITIPESVTMIGDSAFYSNTSVYWTGNYAFGDNIFLESLNEQTEFIIPDTIAGKTITQIGDYAFADKTSLTKVTIPSSVAHIGNHAFSNCTNLSEVDITDETSSISGSTPFSGCTQFYGTILSIKTGYHRIIDNVGRLKWEGHNFVYNNNYSSTQHDLVCTTCGYETTKDHNKQVVNGIETCSVCPWVGDVHINHEYTHSYIPIPYGKIPVNRHKAYCFCGEYREEMCWGTIAEDGKPYCIYCHRDMSGGLGQILRTTSPESDFYNHDIHYLDDCRLNDCCFKKDDQFFSGPKNVLYIDVKRREKSYYDRNQYKRASIKH